MIFSSTVPAAPTPLNQGVWQSFVEAGGEGMGCMEGLQGSRSWPKSFVGYVTPSAPHYLAGLILLSAHMVVLCTLLLSTVW